MMTLATFSSDNRWAIGICAALCFALVVWSRRSVRRGKPAIPQYVVVLVPLAAYLLFLQFSLPFTMPPVDRSPDQQSYEEENAALRRDLDRAILNLDQLTAVNKAVLDLAWLAIVIIVSNWLVPRMDDRNWIHGGIRPPPDNK